MKTIICDCSKHVKGEPGGGEIIVRDMTPEEIAALMAGNVEAPKVKTKIDLLEEEIEKLKAAISKNK